MKWRLQYYFSYFIDADEAWGLVRLLTALAVILCFVFIGHNLEPAEAIDASSWATSLQTTFPPLNNIPHWLLAYCLSYLKPAALRHWIAPASAVTFAIAAGMLYVQDIFELQSFRLACRYMIASLFGICYPSLTIRNGQKDLKRDDPLNPIDQIGGPGYLNVKLGNAVLLERGAGPTRVVGSGRHFLRRFESIREILDLREMYRHTQEIEAYTKDGIGISIRDVESTFGLHKGKRMRSEIDPFPFSIKAARVATYERTVQKDGNLRDWGDWVMGTITNQISNWVTHQRLDRLTAPVEEEPRVAIRQQFQTREVRERLRGAGAELIWVNIGHLDTPADVDKQRAETWRSFWQSQDKVTEARGKALGIAYEELGRSEGQADMLQAIASALESTAPDELDERLVEIVLLRIGRVLEVMTQNPKLEEPKQIKTDQSESSQ
jgi:hypothetical protein